MTEAEWLDCSDPRLMLQSLGGGGSERKLRLFACARCRHGWPALTRGEYRAAVAVAEAFADGGVGECCWNWRTSHDLVRPHPAHLRRQSRSV
jgi:hypothetical protein